VADRYIEPLAAPSLEGNAIDRFLPAFGIFQTERQHFSFQTCDGQVLKNMKLDVYWQLNRGK
jgi:hypothetical protein